MSTSSQPLSLTPDDSVDALCPDWPSEFIERYQAQGLWTNDTFTSLLADQAQRIGERTAVIDGEREYSYRELNDLALRAAYGLTQLGIQRGDRVVLQLPNRVEFIIAAFGLFRIGALPIYTLPAHRRQELEHFCRFAGARAIITVDQFDRFSHRELARSVQQAVPSVEQLVICGDADGLVSFDSLLKKAPIDEQLPTPPKARDMAFFQLSGGTTGVSKLIPRRHDSYICSLRGSNDVCRINEHTRLLIALPIAHNFPMSSPGFLGVMLAGGSIVLAPSPSADVCFELIARHRVTMTSAVPPLALAWLQAAERLGTEQLDSLTLLQVGGAKLVSSAAKRIRPVLGCQLQQVFGMAEGLVNYTRLDDSEEIITHTQGRPMYPEADEVLIVDQHFKPLPAGQPGQLITRGPYTIRGYFNAPEVNANTFTSDGFYCTGDIAVLTENGDIVVEGREKDQINRGGEKISMDEVENALLAHPGIYDAAVVGIPDEYLGERAVAFVVPKQGETLKKFELSKFLREHIAAYKVPDRFELIDAFPQSGVGKVSRKVLREILKDQLDNA
ncbi:2,3-dihydroxybenzoate-AMP ligase [Carnimonas sp. R-84981]|uniref:(2,3-dihydroxybenzoyl)adenylate synthase n=1 Tax=Carnimonas bestiolae TaxID=3402172 RepID=UPI003EDC114E